MRPLDPRLLRYASATRGVLAAGALLTLLQTAATVAFAWLVTDLVVGAIRGEAAAELGVQLGSLLVVVAVRAGFLWAAQVTAARGGATVVGQLRERLLGSVARLGPGWTASRSAVDVTLVAGRGMEALDRYFSGYLPQLVATAVTMPLLVVVIGWQDLTSGVILLVTLPLIPVFMVLVGWATQSAQSRQWSALSSLSRGFLDVVGGLSTLKLYGRQHRQEARIRAVSEEYRLHTMRVLRMSFLSGFVLELAASLSVAVIAVTIGLRLLSGSLDLTVGLFVLLLAPEAFLPLRNVGAGYHAATEGIEAASRAFAVIEEAEDLPRAAAAGVAPTAARAGADRAGEGIRFDNVTVGHGGKPPAAGFSASVLPGELVVLSAPSGGGKTSLLRAALGFTRFDGRISAGGRDDVDGRRDAIAWSGQLPGLLAGTVASNIALGDPAPSAAAIHRALTEAAAGDLSPETVLGSGGSGLSGGQAQRVAVARALYRLRTRGCPVLILDEPTSALDTMTERALVASLRHIADEGIAVVVASHRPAVAAAADRVIELQGVARV
ncbi:thiol reductant ABC exporter subunit CydD [Leifsonia sp. AG29]|uniref:thiol reductant ABC exporter subunit CydD n=1 Tax=Leifsonia sp. AG29 TaxID=2598860 RepID=UPI00131BE7F7|nr:thiol reductant ABC exporter subunit CydD [Leifsonia sp. AG29]